MLRVLSCLTTEHDFGLVIVAAVVCLLSMLTAFMLAAQIGEMRARRRLRWLAALGFVSGGGIWATHFIAMLAYQPHLPTAYELPRTALSIGVGVAASTAAWRAFFSKRAIWRLAAPVIFAIGVAAMHKTGMTALQTTGRIVYDGTMIAGSVMVGIVLSYAGFHWAEKRWRRIPLLPALGLVLAIVAIHFGSMAAVTIYPESGLTIDPSTIESETLALMIATLAAAILAVGLVTALAEARIARHAQHETDRLKSFSESALEALAILENDVIVDANTTFWGLAGYDPVHPPEGLGLSELLPDVPSDAPQRCGPGFFNAQVRARDGERIDVEMAFRRGQLLGVERDLVVLRDVSEKTAAAARVAHLAAHDPLTGAANRLSLNHLLADALTRSSEQAPVALLCLDLDRFKTVNDVHGHATGDALLVEVTRRIRECMTGREALARLGGDEFAIVQPGGDQPHRAASLAREILDALAVPMRVAGRSIRTGASIGIAIHPDNAATVEELHTKADLALYRAKAQGRGTMRFFDANMDAQLVRQLELQHDLQFALQRGELSLVYQPIACLVTGAIIGFEALLRWTHPEHGEIPPAEFIPLAEDGGMIVPIGEWVLRSACREAGRWRQPLKISVNLSPAQIAQTDITDMIASALVDAKLSPRRLDLEVTEGLLVGDPDGTLTALRRVKELGVGVAMDDFGTGYSSLAYFRAFPFDEVKIDRSFIRDVTTSREALAIIRAVIGLGKGLGMSIIAEGVETEAQMQLLLTEGCDKIQGYLVGTPASIGSYKRSVFARRPTPCSDPSSWVDEWARLISTEVPRRVPVSARSAAA